MSAPSALFSAAADALGSAGARGLILTSNDDIAGRMSAAIGAGHGVWPFVPLGPVLDRCQAVIHAGGHGTNAAVLTAGLPSAIVPAVTDQVWHARRIEQLGVGVRVKRRELGEAVRTLIADGGLRERAGALGRKLRAENGPAAAADLVEIAIGR